MQVRGVYSFLNKPLSKDHLEKLWLIPILKDGTIRFPVGMATYSFL
jgi:hypothetical protein